MSEYTDGSFQCPHCGTLMVQGTLRGLGETIHVETLQSLEDSPLRALICLACGHVELQAIRPENLTRHDITDEELDCLDERF
jgi:hypothetical protein